MYVVYSCIDIKPTENIMKHATNDNIVNPGHTFTLATDEFAADVGTALGTVFSHLLAQQRN